MTPLFSHSKVNFAFNQCALPQQKELTKDQIQKIREILACLALRDRDQLLLLIRQLKSSAISNKELDNAVRNLENSAENAITSAVEAICAEFNIFVPVYQTQP